MKRENKIKLWVTIGLFIAMGLITFDLMAQSTQAKDHAKLQKTVEWENYQATWKKVELEKAKEIRKTNKEQSKEAKQRQKFFAKLERIKE